MDFHLPIIDTPTGTFFLTEGVPTTTSITCDRRLSGIPLISHLQARRAIRKGAECALLYVRVKPQFNPSIHNISEIKAPAKLEMDPRMKALVDKYQHLML